MKRYRLYGLDLASSLPFASAVPEVPESEAGAPPDVTFELVRSATGAVLPVEASDEQVVYRSPERGAHGESVLVASRAGSWIALHYAGEATLGLDEDVVRGRPERPGADGLALVELRLLGPGLACWLERSGLLALHAAAVTVEGRAVALLSANHGGKSCLAATLVASGLPLLTDDVLALETAPSGGFLARPSYPQMRLWPPDAVRFAGSRLSVPSLPRAHPDFDKVRVPVGAGGLGTFDLEPRPTAVVYLPERRAVAAPAVEPLPPRAALVAVLRRSFLPRLVEALGWGPRRLDLLARLVREVPVRRLVLPDGFEHLPRIRDALLEDVADLP